jgi:hypothetical protein
MLRVNGLDERSLALKVIAVEKRNSVQYSRSWRPTRYGVSSEAAQERVLSGTKLLKYGSLMGKDWGTYCPRA